MYIYNVFVLSLCMQEEENSEETELWIDDCNDAEVIDVSSSHSNANGFVKVYVMFLLSWQSLFRVSDSGMNIVFRGVSRK